MMKSILIFLSIICAVARTDDVLKCIQCQKTNSDTCEGESVNCPNCTQCMVASELLEIGNSTYHSIRKDCNPGFPCKQLYCSDFNNAIIRVSVQCCTGDNCNTDNYKMPPEDIERKGKICPACFKFGSTECISDDTERCIHPEDQCVDYLGKVRDPGNNVKDYSYKGCISPLGCKFKFSALVGLQEVENEHFICTPGK
ncbi:phospholipase A2 inhibitor gamma subunit B-like [Mixophyes fleayi]|uniref:phospholipase A2 inhibitor gamma subunit B-like n=1 Tax=Mixophyes fleayi TaxID=3061075 RepID=UPI003F4D9046